jgi:hypothetical protein
MTISSDRSSQQLINDYFWDLESRVVVRHPNNLYQEKIKFFNSKFSYNPQFDYLPIKEVEFSQEIENSIENIEDPDIRKLYLEKVQEYRLRNKLRLQVGKSAVDFTENSIRLHGKPDIQSLLVAKKITSQMPAIIFDRKDVNNVRFKRLKKEIKKYLKENRLKGGLTIKHQQSVANAVSVSKRTGRVNVSDNYIADKDEVIDVVYHELETHMRRLENGSGQEYGIFKIGTAGYLACEEGLAPIMGHVFKKNQLLWHPALLLIAIDKALQSDFVTVFETIHSIINEPFVSWTYAVRVKNGLRDTGEVGAHTKDLYLKWAIQVAEELIKHPELLQYAFNGKAKLFQLKQFTKTPEDYHPKITIIDIANLAKVNHFGVNQ